MAAWIFCCCWCLLPITSTPWLLSHPLAFLYIPFYFIIRLHSINSISYKVRLYGRINPEVSRIKEKRGCHGVEIGGNAGDAGKSDDINFNMKVTCCAPFLHSHCSIRTSNNNNNDSNGFGYTQYTYRGNNERKAARIFNREFIVSVCEFLTIPVVVVTVAVTVTVIAVNCSKSVCLYIFYYENANLRQTPHLHLRLYTKHLK